MNLLVSGHTEEEVLSSILSSLEYNRLHFSRDNSMFVESLYNSLLGRSAEASALNYWVHVALPLVGRWGVAYLMMNSYEFRQRNVVAVFRDRLNGRVPTGADLAADVFSQSDLLAVRVDITANGLAALFSLPVPGRSLKQGNTGGGTGPQRPQGPGRGPVGKGTDLTLVVGMK